MPRSHLRFLFRIHCIFFLCFFKPFSLYQSVSCENILPFSPAFTLRICSLSRLMRISQTSVECFCLRRSKGIRSFHNLCLRAGALKISNPNKGPSVTARISFFVLFFSYVLKGLELIRENRHPSIFSSQINGLSSSVVIFSFPTLLLPLPRSRHERPSHNARHRRC